MIAHLVHVAALALLLAQMRRAQLHRAERSFFCFFAAWLAACATWLVLDLESSPLAPALYLALNLVPFLFAAPALARAARQLVCVPPASSGEEQESAAVAIIWPFVALVAVGVSGREVFLHWPDPAAAAHIVAFNAAAWWGAVAGAIFLASSFCEEPGARRTLARGVGVYLAMYHGGQLLIAAVQAPLAALQLLLFAAAAAAVALAFHIGPRPDALVNPEVLAVVPAGRLAATTTPSAVATYAGLDTAHHAPCAPPPPLSCRTGRAGRRNG